MARYHRTVKRLRDAERRVNGMQVVCFDVPRGAPPLPSSVLSDEPWLCAPLLYARWQQALKPEGVPH